MILYHSMVVRFATTGFIIMLSRLYSYAGHDSIALGGRLDSDFNLPQGKTFVGTHLPHHTHGMQVLV